MSPLIPISLVGWTLLTPLLFALMPQRRAVLVCVIGATLFLPMAQLAATGLPELHKFSAVGCGLLVGIAIFGTTRLASLRLDVADCCMAVGLLVPAASVMSNDLEFTYAVSSSLTEILRYGLPYLAGRLYFHSSNDARDLAYAIIIGGALYVPFCWIEIRLSPQLHTWVYGFHQHDFIQSYRRGGWRPTVFMQHGLMVGAWMMTSALLAAWLWAGGNRTLLRVPMGLYLGAIAGTLLFLKSLGAILLFAAGIGQLLAVRFLRAPVLVTLLVFVPVGYLTSRIAFRWDGTELVTIAASFSEDRAESLAFRLRSEEVLIERAMERPLLGWAGYGRNLILGEGGKPTAVTDSFWVATLGTRGLVGMISTYGWLTIPSLLAAWRFSKAHIRQHDRYIVLGLCAVSILYVVDTMFNSMVNQVYYLLAGALCSFGGKYSPSHFPSKSHGESPSARSALVGLN